MNWIVRADFPTPMEGVAERMAEGEEVAHHHRRRRQVCTLSRTVPGNGVRDWQGENCQGSILWTWHVARNVNEGEEKGRGGGDK